jgi:transcriptional regulator with XRE-family HTH domain
MSLGLGDLTARNVRAERGRLRWRQDELAARLGVSQTTVSALESGRRRIDVDDLLPLCQVLQVPLTRLLVGATREQLQVLGLGECTGHRLG